MKNGATNKERTSISHSTSIVGDIRVKEHLVINGTVRGNITINNYSLFIGPSGRLEGEIHAQNVRVRGHMKGKIKAKGKVEITQEAHFSGEIISKSIYVENGAYFDASVELGRGSPKTEDLQTTSSETPFTEIG